MTQLTIRKIQSLYSRLSDKEKNIADYMITNRQQIIHSTISEIAAALGVADATVFRFCKRIGFNGFQDLKIALAADVSQPIQPLHEEVSAQDDVHTIAQKVFNANIRTLENTFTLLTPGVIEKATTLLENAKHIYFYGTGGSAIIAMDAYHKFMRTGVPTFAFIDSHFQLMSASQLTADDVAVVISHSGANRDTQAILKTIQERGAKSIAITAFPKSVIAQKADITLLTTSEETEFRSEALSSRIAQLSIIDALYVNLVVQNQERSQVAMKKLRAAISQTRS